MLERNLSTIHVAVEVPPERKTEMVNKLAAFMIEEGLSSFRFNLHDRQEADDDKESNVNFNPDFVTFQTSRHGQIEALVTKEGLNGYQCMLERTGEGSANLTRATNAIRRALRFSQFYGIEYFVSQETDLYGHPIGYVAERFPELIDQLAKHKISITGIGDQSIEVLKDFADVLIVNHNKAENG